MDEFKQIVAQACTSAREEPGCLRFDAMVDPKNENNIFFYQAYKDQAAFDYHKI